MSKIFEEGILKIEIELMYRVRMSGRIPDPDKYSQLRAKTMAYKLADASELLQQADTELKNLHKELHTDQKTGTKTVCVWNMNYMHFRSDCGKEGYLLESDFKYCPHCGKEIKVEHGS